MPTGFDLRTLWACLVVAVTALAVWIASASIEGAVIALVGGIAAVLLVGSREDTPLLAPAPMPRGPDPALVLDAVAEPLLLIENGRVALANRAARLLLGEHIGGEDVRVALRHPAAAERLARPDDLPDEPVELVGLGPIDRRWEMRVATLGDGRRLIQLADRTGSYAAERMRVDFVANASHELRTPLASILGFIETLEEAGEDAATRTRFLKIMSGEANRMQRLVSDLISLSRIEAEKYRLPSDAVDLAALIDEVCRELAETAERRGSTLRLAIEPVSPVGGDRAQLSQALHNLIGNAMKYGRAGTPVTISLAPDGVDMVRLAVSDEGEGIAATHLPRLTERFYRVDAGRSRSLGGTGLGLAIVKHIVERHRGRLDISSRMGVGTIVAVTLPALSSSSHASVTEGEA